MKAPFLFQGEEMTCCVCGEKAKSDPDIESNWRAIQLGSDVFYACPNEFPPDNASSKRFKQAYIKVLSQAVTQYNAKHKGIKS